MNPSNSFEKEVRANGFQHVAGVDEVGRGCLAGPVVAAAVVMPPKSQIIGVKDSKLLSAKKREDLYKKIYQEALGIGIGSVNAQVIDQVNILQASIQAMQKAVDALNPRPNFVLVDGNLKDISEIPQRSIPKGDRLCFSIAAASIIAKVFRDNLMLQFNEQYPQYGLNSNKGYPTSHHLTAIKKNGITQIHRKTFKGVKEFSR
jgi:ribonuclease HII